MNIYENIVSAAVTPQPLVKLLANISSRERQSTFLGFMM